jgi:hypothetical protein
MMSRKIEKVAQPDAAREIAYLALGETQAREMAVRTVV